MSAQGFPLRIPCRVAEMLRFRLWHLSLLVVYVAIATLDVRDHTRGRPHLMALAAAGYACYALFCWLAWHLLRRSWSRVGDVLFTALYALLMAVVFLAAVAVYLVIESAHLR